MAQQSAIDTASVQQLPRRAAQCLKQAAARDHTRANKLRIHSAAKGNRQQPRRTRMRIASSHTEATSRDTAAEARA